MLLFGIFDFQSVFCDFFGDVIQLGMQTVHARSGGVWRRRGCFVLPCHTYVHTLGFRSAFKYTFKRMLCFAIAVDVKNDEYIFIVDVHVFVVGIMVMICRHPTHSSQYLCSFIMSPKISRNRIVRSVDFVQFFRGATRVWVCDRDGIAIRRTNDGFVRRRWTFERVKTRLQRWIQSQRIFWRF